MNSRKVQIPVSLLEVGMFITDLDRPWEDTPFLMQGFELHDENDIKIVREVCDYVYIDPSKQSIGPISKSPKPTHSISFQENFSESLQTFAATRSLIKSSMDDIRFGRALDVNKAKHLVSECVKNIIKNQDTMLLLTQLKDRDEYTSQHSMNVCVLAITLGKQLKLPPQQLELLGLCGLFHDIGKMKVPLEILNKEGKLTPEEFQIMKSHSIHGRDILMSARGVYPGTVDVAYSHHERLDGKGYPRGIGKQSLNAFTKIVTIVDAYDAITSDRCYQRQRSHLNAIHILTKGRNTQFEPQYTILFIQCVGIYPPGSLIELHSGEIAIVIEVSDRKKTLPKILVVRDKLKRPCTEFILDLSEDPVNEIGLPYRIKTMHKPLSFGVDLKSHLKFFQPKAN